MNFSDDSFKGPFISFGGIPFIKLFEKVVEMGKISEPDSLKFLSESRCFLSQAFTISLLEEYFIHVSSVKYNTGFFKRQVFQIDSFYRLTVWMTEKDGIITHRNIEVEYFKDYDGGDGTWAVIGHISYPKTLDSFLANIENIVGDGILQYKIL